MPKAILVKLRDQNVHNVHRGDMITPSALKGCTRKLVLERTWPYYYEPEKLYYAVRGALIHGFLENHGLHNVHTEVRLYKKVRVNGQEVILSGQIDFYDGDERSIEDYKTMSDKGTYFLFDSGAKPEHVLQTNVYRWLCDGGYLEDPAKPGNANAAFAYNQQVFWPVDKIRIHMLFMNRVVSTGSTHIERVTGYKEPNMGKKYKLERSRKVVDVSPRGVPVWEIEIAIPPVKLMSEEDILAHVEMGGIELRNGFDAVQQNRLPPGVLYMKDESWACGYCGVVEQCHDYEKKTNTEKFEKHLEGIENAKSKFNRK